jgi:hypothetical protein
MLSNKKMPDYSKCVIYEIVCKDSQIKDSYIGSTCNFRKRKCDHKTCCNNEKDSHYNFHLYTFIRKNGGWNNFEMWPIARVKCNDKIEKLMWERKYIERTKPSLNYQFPLRTRKEYYEKEKEHIKEQRKQYRKDNKELIKEAEKQYREKNKEKISEYNKKYTEDRRIKIKCTCGSEIYKYKMNDHIKTKKHLAFIAQ